MILSLLSQIKKCFASKKSNGFYIENIFFCIYYARDIQINLWAFRIFNFFIVLWKIVINHIEQYHTTKNYWTFRAKPLSSLKSVKLCPILNYEKYVKYRLLEPCCFHHFVSEHKICIVGLDNAGKTTILYQFLMNEVVQTSPTIGSNVEEVVWKNIHFIMWDLGGQESLRAAWNTYYSNTEVIFF